MDLLDEDAYLYNPYTATPTSDHEDDDEDAPVSACMILSEDGAGKQEV